MNDKDLLLVFSTCPDPATAERLGKALVGESLAACVNIVPGIRSIYVWDGALQDEAEVLLIFKTTAFRFAALRARLLELHPFEVPEVVAVEAAGGHDAYLRWVAAATGTAHSL